MSRNILLIEPNYANKYPPIGLMKIAAYHRMLGDKVRFFKGDLGDLAIERLAEECLGRLAVIDDSVDWKSKQTAVRQFIKSPKLSLLWELNFDESKFKELALNRLYEAAGKFKKRDLPKYDRVYVTTLFTFYWKITVETIEYCKVFVKSREDLFVGGVLATLLHDELERETGIKPTQGLLDVPGVLDPKNRKAKNIVIDDLPLDYSILDEIDYEYPTQSAYFTFMTKGCTRKCAFCSVPVLEPTYKPKIETLDKFGEIKRRFGDQQNLLLMDNNVLASPRFSEIIDEIKAMGFYKGATYVEPNQLEIAVSNLESGYNDFGFTRRAHRLMNALFPRLKGVVKQTYYDVLADYKLLEDDAPTKENVLAAYLKIKDIYEKYRNKSRRNRYVDFNQGTDCRYVTEALMKKMSEIPIRPLRLAFDYLSLKGKYENAVRLAAENGIRELSNYILYNFHDKPEELYERLRINADLCLKYDVAIFSFPMKYIPLFGDESKDRSFTGKHWNKKFVRAIQSILNVTKGIVAPSNHSKRNSFFVEAFGRDLKEFYEILYMPEAYIVYRHPFRLDLGYTEIWENEYRALSDADRATAHRIIGRSDFSAAAIEKENPSLVVREFLRHYDITRHKLDGKDAHHEKTKARFDALIKSDRFIELTLTYDYEAPAKRKKRTALSAAM